MDRRRIVLVRHGESEWNAQGRWQGHGGAGLTDVGRRQAAATAAFLRDRMGDVTVLLSSDLQRVVETAAPAAEALGLPVTEDKAWREIDVGRWTGLAHTDIATVDPDGYAAWRRGDDLALGGAERYSELRARIEQALAELLPVVEGTAVVFTHGGPVRAAAAEVLGLPAGWDVPLSGAANCSVTVLDDAGRGRLRLATYNSTAHL